MVTQRYLKLKSKLQKLGFGESLSEDSCPLVEKLLKNFIKVSELYQSGKTSNQRAEESLRRQEIMADPLELEVKRLTRENNDLHSSVIQEKQLAETIESKYANLYKLSQQTKSDFQYVVQSKDSRIRALIQENAALRTRVDEAVAQSVTQQKFEGNGRVAIELRKRVAEIKKVVSKLQKDQVLVPALNQSVTSLEAQFLTARAEMGDLLAAKNEVVSSLQAARSTLVLKDKEISRLQALVENTGLEKLQNAWLKSVDKEISIQHSYEAQVKLLERENKIMAEGLQEVRNQKDLVETLRREIDMLRTDNQTLVVKYQNAEQESERKVIFAQKLQELREKQQQEFQRSQNESISKENSMTQQIATLQDKNRRIGEEADAFKSKLTVQEQVIQKYVSKIEKLNDELQQAWQYAMDNEQGGQSDVEMAVLRKQINEKNKRLDDLVLERDEFSENVVQLRNKVALLESRITKLMSRPDHNPEITAFEERVTNLTENNKQLLKERTILLQKLEEHKIEVDSLHKTVMDLNRRLEFAKQDGQKQSQWLDLKDQELQNLDVLRKDMETESQSNAQLKLNLLTAENRSQELVTRINVLEGDLRDQKQKMLELDQGRSTNKELVGRLEIEISKLQTRNLLLETESKNKDFQISEIVGKEFDSKNQDLAKLSLLSEENCSLKQQLNDQRTNFKRLKDTLDNVSSDFNSYKTSLKMQTESMVGDDRLLKETVKKNQELRTHSSSKDQQISDLNSKLVQAAGEKQRLEARMNLENDNQSSLRVELGRVKEELRILKNQSTASFNLNSSKMPESQVYGRQAQVQGQGQTPLEMETASNARMQKVAETAIQERDARITALSMEVRQLRMELDGAIGREQTLRKQNEMIGTYQEELRSAYAREQQSSSQQNQQDARINEVSLMAKDQGRIIEDLRAQTEFLQKSNANYQRKISVLERELNEAEIKLTQFRNEVGNSRNVVAHAEEQAGLLNSECQKLRVKMEEREGDALLIEKELKRVMNERDDYKNEVKLARGDKVKSRFQEEIDLLNSKIQGYNEERLEAQSKINDLETQLIQMEKVKREKNMIAEDLQRTSQRTEEYKKQIERLESRVSETEQHLKELLFEKERKENSQAIKFEKDTRTLAGQISSLETRINQIGKERDSVRAEYTTVLDINSKLKRDLNDEQTLNDQLEESIKQLERHKKNSSIEIQRLQSQINQLRIQIDGHIESVSQGMSRGMPRGNPTPLESGFRSSDSRQQDHVTSEYLKKRSEELSNDFQSLLPTTQAKFMRGSGSQGANFLNQQRQAHGTKQFKGVVSINSIKHRKIFTGRQSVKGQDGPNNC